VGKMEKKFNRGLIVGIIISTVVFSLVLIILIFMLNSESNNSPQNEKLSGTFSGMGDVYSFSGNSFTYSIGEHSIVGGTYSIFNDQIEFVFDDGHIQVHYFSRTENTITISRRTFTRR
jgi:hypothetical protein